MLKTPVIVLAPLNHTSDPLWHWRASRVTPRLPQGHHLTQVSMPNLAGCAELKPFCIFLIFVYGLLSRSLPLLAWTAASVTTPPTFYLLTGPPNHMLAAPCQVLLCRWNPAVTWCAAFTGDCMNNLFVEFSLSLTFRCLTPGGSSFNNIDSAPLLCASSDKVGNKQSERTQYQNHGYQGCCVFHTMTFAILSLLKQYIWTCGWGLNGLQAFELANIVFANSNAVANPVAR